MTRMEAGPGRVLALIRQALASRAALFAPILIAAAVFAAFSPALRCGFIHLDDPEYVALNPVVTGGLTAEGTKAAFNVFNGEYWVPVLFLSFMADVWVFGPGPLGFHLVNVLLHGANAALLFWLLFIATRRMIPAGLTALLFALHPMRVESVAWIAQRKDVLFAFFLLLSLAAYGRYARRSGKGRWPWYALSLALFLLSLMTKPMPVAFPLLLLLVDLWPLGRAPMPDRHFLRWCGAHRRLLVEKVPFLALAAAFAVLTLHLQRRLSVPSMDLPSLLFPSMRMYFVYLGQLVWPASLGFRLGEPPMKELVSTGLQAFLMHLLILASIWRVRDSHPHLFSGWLWYLAALLPAVGGVPFGGQWISDRFTYVPMMGVAAGLVFALDRSIIGRRQRLAALVLAASALVGLGLAARSHVGHWTNSVTIAQRSVEISPGDYRAWFSLGNALFNDHDLDGALSAMGQAVRLAPDSALAHGGLGLAYLEIGDKVSARLHLEQGFRLGFANPDARFRLGKTLFDDGDCGGALEHLNAALSTNLPQDQADASRSMMRACLERLGTPLDANRQ